MKREPRYKLFRIDTNTVLSMLNWNSCDCISLPITKGLPLDAVIESVNYDVCRNCFLARVYHDSFDMVSSGVMIPIEDDWLTVEEHIISIKQYNRACEYNTIDALYSEAIKNGDVLVIDNQSHNYAVIPKDRLGKGAI